MAHPVMSMCLACEHLEREKEDSRVCSAFPEGIPEEIWTNRFDHHEPYPGDQGTQFKMMAITEQEAARQKERSR